MWSIKMVLKLLLESKTSLASLHTEKTVPDTEYPHQRQKNTQFLKNSCMFYVLASFTSSLEHFFVSAMKMLHAGDGNISVIP